MKKIILSGLALVALTSCGTAEIAEPKEALIQNQTALIEGIEKIYELTPEQTKSVGTISFNVEAKEGNANGDIKYDFQSNQTKYESSGNLKAKISIQEEENGAMGIGTLSTDLDLDLITLKNKFLFKINTFKVTGLEDTPELAMMLGMVEMFKEKWYFIDNVIDSSDIVNQENLLLKQKELLLITKKYTVLEYIKTNENADFYDYDVKLNEENLVSIYKEFAKLMDDEEISLTEDDIEIIRENIQDFNKDVQMNIKIDKSELKYFTLTLIGKDGNVIIDNHEKDLRFVFTQDEDSLSIKGEKSKNGINADILIVESQKEIFKGDLSVELDGTEAEIKLNGTAKDESLGEEVKFNIALSDKTTKSNVEIKEPTDAKNFQEAIGQIMGGGF